jgi:hypothetical protein
MEKLGTLRKLKNNLENSIYFYEFLLITRFFGITVYRFYFQIYFSSSKFLEFNNIFWHIFILFIYLHYPYPFKLPNILK